MTKVELLNLIFNCVARVCNNMSRNNVQNCTIYSLIFISIANYVSIIQSFQEVKWRKQMSSILRSRTLWGR